jgi:hypothetical protein
MKKQFLPKQQALRLRAPAFLLILHLHSFLILTAMTFHESFRVLPR